MKITAISQQVNNNLKTFKGEIKGPIPIEKYYPGYTGRTEIVGFRVPDGAVPNYAGAYPNVNTKIYYASPFEIVPDEIYKSTDYVMRNDLRLGDIRNRYHNGYQNFAHNAYEEQQFIKNLRFPLQAVYNSSKNRIEHFEERKEYVNSDYVKLKYQARIDEEALKLNKILEDKKPLDELYDTACQRYELLKEMDDTAGELNKHRNEVFGYNYHYAKDGGIKKAIEEQYEEADKIFKDFKIRRSEYKSHIEAYEKTLSQLSESCINDEKIKFYKNAKEGESSWYSAYKEIVSKKLEAIRNKVKYLRELPETIKKRKIEISNLEEQLEKCMTRVEKLYRTKYPTWL